MSYVVAYIDELFQLQEFIPTIYSSLRRLASRAASLEKEEIHDVIEELANLRDKIINLKVISEHLREENIYHTINDILNKEIPEGFKRISPKAFFEDEEFAEKIIALTEGLNKRLSTQYLGAYKGESLEEFVSTYLQPIFFYFSIHFVFKELFSHIIDYLRDLQEGKDEIKAEKNAIIAILESAKSLYDEIENEIIRNAAKIYLHKIIDKLNLENPSKSILRLFKKDPRRALIEFLRIITNTLIDELEKILSTHITQSYTRILSIKRENSIPSIDILVYAFGNIYIIRYTRKRIEDKIGIILTDPIEIASLINKDVYSVILYQIYAVLLFVIIDGGADAIAAIGEVSEEAILSNDILTAEYFSRIISMSVNAITRRIQEIRPERILDLEAKIGRKIKPIGSTLFDVYVKIINSGAEGYNFVKTIDIILSGASTIAESVSISINTLIAVSSETREVINEVEKEVNEAKPLLVLSALTALLLAADGLNTVYTNIKLYLRRLGTFLAGARLVYGFIVFIYDKKIYVYLDYQTPPGKKYIKRAIYTPDGKTEPIIYKYKIYKPSINGDRFYRDKNRLELLYRYLSYAILFGYIVFVRQFFQNPDISCVLVSFGIGIVTALLRMLHSVLYDIVFFYGLGRGRIELRRELEYSKREIIALALLILFLIIMLAIRPF